MKRNKKRVKLEEALHYIDGVLASLDAYPSLEDALLERIQKESDKYLGKFFPTQLDFSKEVLEHLVGTDVLIDIVSEFLTVALPGVEVSLKGVLLANMQNLGTNCSIDPIIYEKAIKEGVIFDLRQIDLYDKLTVSPLDRKIGQYFYFGTEGCQSSYDILQSAIGPDEVDFDGDLNGREIGYADKSVIDSVGHYFGARKRDFDCLLWYMKNKAVNREVWGKRNSKSESIFNDFSAEGNIEEWIEKKGKNGSSYYTIDGNKVTSYKKGEKEPNKGELVPVDETDYYIYKDGNKAYVYKFGKPSIKRLSRKKYYAYRKNLSSYDVFLYDSKGKKWINALNIRNEKYRYMEELPTDISGSSESPCFVDVDNCIYAITGKPTIKDDVIVKIPNEKCIDITNDIKNNTCLFVDEETVVTETTKTSLPGIENDGNKKWYKKPYDEPYSDKDETYKNCYYIKKSGGDGFDPDVDIVLIPPRWPEKTGNEERLCISLYDYSNKNGRYTKDFGVLTLEYSPRTGNVLQSDGNPMSQQTPYDNVLHVFFGNVKELPDSTRDAIGRRWADSSETNRLGVETYNKLKSLYELHNSIYKEYVEFCKKNKHILGKDEEKNFRNASLNYESLLSGKKYVGEDDIKVLTGKINEVNKVIEEYRDRIYPSGKFFDYNEFNGFVGKLTGKEGPLANEKLWGMCVRISEIMESDEKKVYLAARDFQYPDAVKNYYYKKTLFEFNADYINSIQLFDSKVLAAQIISSLVGGITISGTIGTTATWKTELIRDVVKDMVEKVIASEDISVSDCFFTFTNDAYNGMLRAAELRQAGLYSKHGEENGNNRVDTVGILENLNGIDSSADQAGKINIIKGAIEHASEEICKDIYLENNYIGVNTKFGMKMSFIESLMINLCTQVVMAMLSPKVYLLILINLEMFGLTTNFDIKSFIENFSNIIRSIVKSVVDKFMEYVSEKIRGILEELLQKLATKITFEQSEMYMRLLKQILMHLRMLSVKDGANPGWTQDIIGSADIISDSQEPVNEC